VRRGSKKKGLFAFLQMQDFPLLRSLRKKSDHILLVPCKISARSQKGIIEFKKRP
jgi:hypothetical protein